MIRLAWLAVLALLLAGGGPLAAQGRPDVPWRTIATPHFRVHFEPALESLARRAAVDAEAAYAKLAVRMHPPRGSIQIVLADHVDYANGFATPYPYNRITLYARPPVDDNGLRVHADWMQSLITHELTHIFQVDRIGGLWIGLQGLFGRAAPFFPHTYTPAWLTEGIAVHNESSFEPGGRLHSSEFGALVRALAIDSLLPPLDQVTRATPFYPGGNVSYVIGSQLIDAIQARTTTDDDQAALADFFELLSNRLVPYRLDATARSVFGASFTSVYNTWRDSLTRTALRDAPTLGPDVARVRPEDVIATPGWTVRFPRFDHDGNIVWAGDAARRTPGLYTLDSDGGVRRLGRRTSVDMNAPLADGRVLYAELDYVDRYALRSALYVARGARRSRVPSSERLAQPDAHPSAGIVAVHTTPGATELVVRDIDGRAPAVVLAAGSPDRTWADPRFSRSGQLVAAALWERGGRQSIVVLDVATRAERMRFSPGGIGLVASPAWIGDSIVVFVSDHEGVPAIYRGDVRTGAYGPLWSSPTALYTPDVSADGSRIAAVELRGTGYRLVSRAMPDAPPMRLRPEDAAPMETTAIAATPAVSSDASSQRYSAWPTLRPTWWLPTILGSSVGGNSIGGMTGGSDAVGRHAWSASLLRNIEHPEFSGSFVYDYAGLGNPTVGVSYRRRWTHYGLYTTGGQLVGALAERSDLAIASVIAARPRLRINTYAYAAAQQEWLDYRTYPGRFLAVLDSNGFSPDLSVPAFLVGASASTMQRPGLAVSEQDGARLDLTLYQYPGDAVGGRAAHEARMKGVLAKALDLPGYARHVVAVRGALGVASVDARRALSVGGVSGGSLELFPGVVVGSEPRDFFVRGVPAAAQRGTRAVTGSAEYRAPLARVGRGYKLVPASLLTLSGIAFTDVGSAWCGAQVADSPVCGDSIARPREWMQTVGAELILDATIQYDTPYRFRLGVAKPVRGATVRSLGPAFYFSVGNTF